MVARSVGVSQYPMTLPHPAPTGGHEQAQATFRSETAQNVLQRKGTQTAGPPCQKDPAAVKIFHQLPGGSCSRTVAALPAVCKGEKKTKLTPAETPAQNQSGTNHFLTTRHRSSRKHGPPRPRGKQGP
ncbi:hypothetical protein NDU88_004634 [Pleurodeles waltl]|uniref:Uncharacterized protein n=1 Tax=Pleurodeles waltl TaxID=8319 RepID=A0AAV7T861_PLEWA|nr:hypothetical protein NDU88_004634 [Pleurodeles waltl]